MEKKQHFPDQCRSGFMKLFLVMKLATFFLFISGMAMAANSYSQETRFDLNVKNANIIKIFDEIKRITEFGFLFKTDQLDLNQKFSFDIKNENIENILNEVLDKNRYDYKIIDRNIVITRTGSDSRVLQQQKPVSGKVTDSSGASLPGVSVVVKGTSTGVITDNDGTFSISNIPNNAILQFSFVGMKTQEVTVGGKTTINLTLIEDAIGIEEVVAVGYGVQKKVNVVGSISQVSSGQLEGRSVPQLSDALAGQMTGVTVINRSGAPGASGTISVRGVGSFGASPDALVLVDGIPGNINDVRPEEVASISVLKDASSAAIYGARAANGVILITTKAGKSAKVKVSYNMYGGFVKPTALPELLNSWDYALAYNEASGTQRYSADEIAKFKSGDDPINYPNFNMLKQVINRNGFQTGHDLTLTGGSDINQYYLAIGYLSQDGVVEKNNFSRYSARLNMISSLTPTLKVTTRLSGVSSQVKEPAVPGGKDVFRMSDGIIRNSARYPSIYSTILPNGDYGIGPESGGTPVAWLNSPSFFENPTWKFNSNVDITFTPIKELVLSAIGGYNFSYNETKLYRSTMRLNDNVSMGPSSLSQTSARSEYKTFQATADYNKKFGRHSLSVLLGYSFEKQGYRNMVGSRDKFPGNDLPYLDAGAPDNQQTSGGGYDWAIQSLFGRVKYNYSEKYLFETTVRNDGSSRFPTTKKYGLFPSLAAGWRISEEPFVKDRFNWITNLKIKASWGKLGNQNIGNYPWQSTYQLGRDYVFGGVFKQGAAMMTLTDQNLHWESTQTTDGGFESSLWGGKLNLNASYFYRKTTNILYKPTSSVSTVLGMSLSEMNTGSLQNSGWEFEIGHQNKIGAFKYHISANFTIINNKVLDLGVGNVIQPNGLVGNGSNLFNGYPMQLYYGLKTDGVFLDQADIDAWYLKNDQSSINPKSGAKPGDFRYVDISGDGKVDLSNDRKVLGSQIPKYNYSLNLGLEYKGFDFSAMLQGVEGVKGMLGDYSGYAFFNLGTVQEWMWKGRFDPANPTRYPEYPRLQILGNSAGVNGQLSDFWVLNAAYLRLKTIQIGYTFSPPVLKFIHVDGLRIYANAENPLTFDHYRKGWDPEINSTGDFYPILATYTFGINLKF
jgi:TonB-linked SusC/RagA family outer membrane protein